jgi:hypothetical protein
MLQSRREVGSTAMAVVMRGRFYGSSSGNTVGEARGGVVAGEGEK